MRINLDLSKAILCKNALCRNGNCVAGGKLTKFNKDATYKLFISAENNLVTVCINNQRLLEKTTDELGVSMQGGGRAAIFSGYYKNQFNNLEIKPIGTNPYIMRFDNLDDCFEYVEI